MQTAKFAARFFLLFLAALAPLMFLVGVIVTIDRWGTQNRFLRNLEAFGKIADAKVSYIDEEYGRAGLNFVDAGGDEKYGILDLRYYSPEVVKTIQPGETVRILYIDKLISESEKTALAEYYADVKSAPPVTAEVWWVLGIAWLIVMLHPQFTFLGMADLDVLLPERFLKLKR